MIKKRKASPKMDFTKQVMTEIKSGQTKMKPKFYFVLGSILTGVGVASSMFSSLIITTITFSRLRKFGLMGLLWSGKPLFAPMPIFILLLSLLILWGGLKLLKNYEFSYKHNFIAITIGIVTIIITMSFLFDNLGANQALERHPRLKPFYQQQQPGFSPRPQRHIELPRPNRF